MSNLDPVPVTDIPEVLRFQQAQERYKQFQDANPQLFEYLEALQQEYNTALEAADKAVRARSVSCGDFDLYTRTQKVDAKALHDAVGRQPFIDLGGHVGSVATYTIDKKLVERAVVTGVLNKTIAEEVTSNTAAYHAPKPISLPNLGKKSK
jgi:hypothetical protein